MYLDVQSKALLRHLNTASVLHVKKAGLTGKWWRRELNMHTSCLSGTQGLKTGIMSTSVMRYSLAGGHKESYLSYESRACDTVQTAYKRKRNLWRKTRSGFTVGRPLVITSSHQFTFMMYLATPMAK